MKTSKLRGYYVCIAVLLSVSGIRAQVTIGSDANPVNGALLELKQYDATTDNQTADKGLLYPRVILTDKNELYPMYDPSDGDYTNPAKKADIMKNHTGLTVYNVKENGDFQQGLHVWNGTAWRKISDKAILQPSITSLLCSSISVAPNVYTLGESFEAMVKVPYMGGNGADYPGTPPSATPINGLQIERIGGTLAIGGGEVMYRVFGVPTVTTPTVTTFPIDFLGQTCNIEVGSGQASLNLRNLTQDVTINANFASGLKATVPLPFGEINISETGSYAFSLRLYGRVATGSALRIPYYIYLQKNEKTNLLDAAEIDIVTIKQSDFQDYSYSVTLGGSFKAGDKVIISMLHSGVNWTLRKGSDSLSPVRTSLIYWKL